jgi:UDP-N-acetylmuramoyl-L-alanyl-D-glutamate--2,6-diaminopimelate ligase
MRLTDLTHGLAGFTIQGDPSTDISGIEFDSRRVSPGDLFVALRGGYTDGHRYLRSASDNGAAAAVVEPGVPGGDLDGYRATIVTPDARALLAPLSAAYYGHPSRLLTLVGVTGTDGKTTTSHFIDAIGRQAGRTTGLIGTVQVSIAGQVDLHETRQTTPESLIVQRYLAAMGARGVDTAIIEATSHGLAMHRLDACAFDIGVVTNVTHEHLDFHGSVENYRRAKGGLFRRVAEARAAGKLGIAILNADDEGARSLEADARGCRIVRYAVGQGARADVVASDIVSTGAGSTFTLVSGAARVRVQIHLPGRYNVANALAAAAAGHALGIDLPVVAAGLGALRAVPGRMQTVDEGQSFTVIVDYAHTPEAIRSVLREARRVAGGRVLVLFGSAGERDLTKRGLQGGVAITDADFAVFTSEDPRFEDPERIIADIAAGAVEAGGRPGVDFSCIEDRRLAITAIIERARDGDVVVLAGKGHERSMIYGADKRPWNEAEVARSVLRVQGFAGGIDLGESHA